MNEKIKKLKKNVDVLTLTATPIPRTLHMSLIGIRDMSVLEEAPQDRLPIQTYVMEYNDEMVREAIERECARNGQVYYVYNRVEDIAEVTAHIQKLVPELNVSFAHGQMKEHELEKIMYDFINGDIDVLVSTTIIETGLDISNVNTMIIHDADRLGLSQLYQLRGRVGRSGRMAYAFLLYRKDKLLKEIAEKVYLSTPAVSARIEKMEKEGYILGYQAQVNPEALGYHIKALINLEVSPEEKNVFYPFVRKCSNVIECNCVTGEYSMVLEVLFPSTTELDKFIGELQRFGRTKTLIVFSTSVEHRGINADIEETLE